MAARTIAIGDVHGCDAALAALIDAIAPTSDDLVVPLGDYVDRGPNSSRVIDLLISLSDRCHLVPLLGDHEELLLHALDDVGAMRKWVDCGGAATLKSYGWMPGSGKRALTDWIPAKHIDFLRGCRPWHETATHIFVHAGYLPDLPMAEQPGEALRWRATHATSAVPHCSGQTAVVGHTPQRSGDVLALGFLVCIDTHCVRGGWLTAYDAASGQIWQADASGRMRRFES